MTYLFNKSIQTCKFPSKWKHANVVVLHKGKSRTDVNNYRPISLLPLPAKIMEALIHKRIYNYLEVNEVLTKAQWGFRKGRSTVQAAAGLVESVLVALNERKYSGILFVDLKKAFDSLDHRILVQKLYSCGIKGIMLDWLTDYLHGRQQRVLVNGTSSGYAGIGYGVPQGSCLGPLLFLIYINDLKAVIDENALSLYADDTAVLAIGHDQQEMTGKLQEYTDKLGWWCRMSRLSVHIGKSKVMDMSRGSGGVGDDGLKIYMDGIELETVNHYKYLGYDLDNKLCCSKIMSNTISKMNHALYVFRRIRPALTTRSAIAVFKAKILGYSKYIDIFTYLASKKENKKMQTMQNECIRCIFNLPKRANVDAMHCRLRTLHVENGRLLSLLVHMYKKTLTRDDSLFHVEHGIATRSSEKIMFRIPRPRVEIFRKSFVYQGMLHWNNLSSEEQLIPDVDHFKIAMKRKFLEMERASYGES